MCGRVIQSSGPLRYGLIDGMNVRDSRCRPGDARKLHEWREEDRPNMTPERHRQRKVLRAAKSLSAPFRQSEFPALLA
jgi:hypothetical protein